MKWSDVSLSDGTTGRTSTSLLLLAQANDASAWEQLVQLYSRRVYRWCRRAGLQPADAANIVQEVLRAVARKLADFRRESEHDSFRAWLRRITQNKLRDFYRHEQRHPDRAIGGTDAHLRILDLRDPEWSSGGTTDAPAPIGNPLSQRGERVVAHVRAEFSERDWRIFWRVVVDGQSAVEVGQELGITANAVRLVKMRILRRLREEIARSDDTSSH